MSLSNPMLRVILETLPLLSSSLSVLGEDLIEENILVTASRVQEDAWKLPLAWALS